MRICPYHKQSVNYFLHFPHPLFLLLEATFGIGQKWSWWLLLSVSKAVLRFTERWFYSLTGGTRRLCDFTICSGTSHGKALALAQNRSGNGIFVTLTMLKPRGWALPSQASSSYSEAALKHLMTVSQRIVARCISISSDISFQLILVLPFSWDEFPASLPLMQGAADCATGVTSMARSRD